MVQRREQLRFTLEPRDLLLVIEEIFGQDLDRDFSSKSRVSGFVDLSHSARAKRREDLVRAELRAGGESHRTGLFRNGATIPGTSSASMMLAEWDSAEIAIREPSRETPRDSVTNSGEN